jgi:hypothetical protein
MGLLQKLIGPMSKYEKDLPYTYEARITIIDDENEYNSYLADTICALVEYLEKNNISHDEVKIFEIYKDKETELKMEYCISDKKSWLSQSELCTSFTEHYEGHIFECGCTFEDRERKVTGP